MASALMSCGRRDSGGEAPWGVTEDSIGSDGCFDLSQIVANGELIMLTPGGPDSYYDYHGRKLGLHYMLCQRFADGLGVSLRVEVCRDTSEMVARLLGGEADVIACPLTEADLRAMGDSAALLVPCGVRIAAGGGGAEKAGNAGRRGSEEAVWVSVAEKPELCRALDEWFTPEILSEVRKEEGRYLDGRSVKRRVYSPMLNRSGGVISRYDGLFMTYCRDIRWDWRLMAAQCYQESTFDPQAVSWAGARGLMQIMPSTASDLGLSIDDIHDPEKNIAAAAKLTGQLDRKFSDIKDRNERISFVLASYNGGYHHIRDAMALAGKHGGNASRWEDVSRYVLLLSTPEYYRDSIVKNGYMRGSETVDYVEKIRKRWEGYRGVRGIRAGHSGMEPRKASHRSRKFS
ncbi:transglycosylase SLT domain-containing protein [Xylanibacter muris]|uniref:Transglycosylase SLT domain-containing protein n=2 Tax=Xylanibacter muris TaxID=2736290 RepID=A0ABX2AM79_9BACT|nr:transglycosylase SLT domain-containing protein [Xylanibacter muris]NPD91300.1 transglycosylase SLT domain-containing protein [Xylanibacter muris]